MRQVIEIFKFVKRYSQSGVVLVIGNKLCYF
jgi:hypothetical protein